MAAAPATAGGVVAARSVPAPRRPVDVVAPVAPAGPAGRPLIGGVLEEEALLRLTAGLRDDAASLPGLARVRPAVVAVLGAAAVLALLLVAMTLVGSRL